MKKIGRMRTNHNSEKELYELFLKCKTISEIEQLMRDLCTPQEIGALADRWQICKLLHAENLSYREIADQTGASLATITRVARFLHDEPYQGYTLMLKRIDKKKQKKQGNLV